MANNLCFWADLSRLSHGWVHLKSCFSNAAVVFCCIFVSGNAFANAAVIADRERISVVGVSDLVSRTLNYSLDFCAVSGGARVDAGQGIKNGLSKPVFGVAGSVHSPDVQHDKSGNKSSNDSERPDRDIFDYVHAFLIGLIVSAIPFFAFLEDERRRKRRMTHNASFSREPERSVGESAGSDS